jgi:hypothetical protein
MECLIRTWTRCEHRCRSTIYLAASSYYICRVLMLYYYVLYPAAHVRCRVAGDSHESVHTPVSRQISSRSDCGLAMDHCEGASADAYWPLRVLSSARMPRLQRCRQQKLLQRLLCLFILPFLSFGLRYSPRQLSAATELNSEGLSHLFHLIG